MAHYQNQYSAQSGTEQYGNPIRQTDEYGNVVPDSGQFLDPLCRTGELRDTDQYGVGDRMTFESGGGEQRERQQDKVGQGMFHETPSAATTGPVGYTAAEQGRVHEKKGLMEKIKENLPGGHHHRV